MAHCNTVNLPELIPYLATKAKTLSEAKSQITLYQNIANACEIAGVSESTMPLFNLSHPTN